MDTYIKRKRKKKIINKENPHGGNHDLEPMDCIDHKQQYRERTTTPSSLKCKRQKKKK